MNILLLFLVFALVFYYDYSLYPNVTTIIDSTSLFLPTPILIRSVYPPKRINYWKANQYAYASFHGSLPDDEITQCNDICGSVMPLLFISFLVRREHGVLWWSLQYASPLQTHCEEQSVEGRDEWEANLHRHDQVQVMAATHCFLLKCKWWLKSKWFMHRISRLLQKEQGLTLCGLCEEGRLFLLPTVLYVRFQFHQSTVSTI